MSNHDVRMFVSVVNESGYEQAIEGLSYNKEQPIEKMPRVLEKLAPLGNGHNKALRQIAVWIIVDAPRMWWVEYDTYKIGTTANSQSTMHTIHKRLLEKEDFDDPEVDDNYLNWLNSFVKKYQDDRSVENLLSLKRKIPESFMQKRMVSLNYEVLRNIIIQRKNHRLPHWNIFITSVLDQVKHPELLKEKAD